jgi:hypothetical protein
MKHLYLLVLFISCNLLKVNAQCTPETSLTGTGFYPPLLPAAYTDAPYSQVLSFMSPKDTVALFNGNTVNVVIDSVVMLDLVGIPKNFTYQCLNRCAIPGGGKGCALLSGQADTTQLGSHRIKMYIQTFYHVKNTNFFASQIDSGDSYRFWIYKTTSAPKILKYDEPIQITAYPNPSNTNITIDLSMLPAYSSGQIQIIDLLGRVVYSNAFQYNNSGSIPVSHWDAGLYKCVITSSDQSYYTSFIKY